MNIPLTISEDKPRCRMPATMASTHLIGSVARTLKAYGHRRELELFIASMKLSPQGLDYVTVASIAADFVELHD